MFQKLVLIVALFACASYAAICHSWGDPHNQLLDGTGYSMYNVQGDFTYFKFQDLKVQERVINSATWRTNSLLIGAAVKFGKTVFELLNDETRLNGSRANNADLAKAGISFSGNVYTINYKRISVKIQNHGNNDAIAGKNYLSLFVEVPEDIRKTYKSQLKGLCVSNEIPRFAVRDGKKSLFTNRARFIELPARPPRQFSRDQKRAARKACKGTGIESILTLNNCIFDYLRANNKEQILRAYSVDHEDSIKLRQREKDEAANNKIALDKCRKSLSDLEVQLRRVESQLSVAQQTSRNHEATIARLNNEINNLKRALNDAQNNLRNAENKIRNYISENNNLHSRLNSANNDIRNLNNQLNSLRSQYSQLQADCQRRLAEAQAHYSRQIQQLNVQYNNNLRIQLQQQSQQLTQQFNNVMRQTEIQYNNRLSQAQSYLAQLIAQMQSVINNAKSKRF